MKKRSLYLLLILIASMLLIGCNDAISIVGIEVTTPYKTSYVSGESFDSAGMVVKAIYSDASEKVITDYSIDKTVLTTADLEVTISYQGFNTTVSIT